MDSMAIFRFQLIYVLFGNYLNALALTVLVEPLYQWPLGNTSIGEEVISGRSKMKIADDKKCFMFGPNNEHLPYDAIKIGSDSITDFSVTFKNKKPFNDLTISIFIFPIGIPKGTLLQYAVGEDEKIRVMFDSDDDVAIISFRDEYDNAAGIVGIHNLLTPDIWNHLVIQRTFSTGSIKVLVNGEVRENADNNFQDEVPIPPGGTMLLGSAAEPGAQFEGFLSCLQIFTKLLSEGVLRYVWQGCLKEKWKHVPKVKLKSDPQNRPGVQCLDESELCTMTSLTNEEKWTKMKKLYKWSDSKRINSYFALTAKQRSPSTATVTMGIVETTNLRTCARLCMRVSGCQSFVVEDLGGISRNCKLYNSRFTDLIPKNYSNYYELQN